MVRYEAHNIKDWKTQDLTRVVVARTRDDGSIEVGVFLIDRFEWA